MSGLSSPRRERNQIEKLKLGPQDWMGMTLRNLIGKRCWLSWCLEEGSNLDTSPSKMQRTTWLRKFRWHCHFWAHCQAGPACCLPPYLPTPLSSAWIFSSNQKLSPGSAWDYTHVSFHIFQRRDWSQLLVAPVWRVRHIKGNISREQIGT